MITAACTDCLNGKVIGPHFLGHFLLIAVTAFCLDPFSSSLDNYLPVADELSVGGIRLNIHDIQSGHITSRKLWWKDFICGADAIVFVIDVSDRELFEESKNELDVSVAPGPV